jgi:16S rRNA (guanine966-N2)-methyltransferase
LYEVGSEREGIIRRLTGGALLCWGAMRIIAGKFRSRVLAGPRGTATRPTSDRLRETLFNVLAARIEGAAFLDLYAGSGAVGLEAMSRGARVVAFVDRAPAALKTLRANLAALEVERGGFRVEAAAVRGVLRRMQAGTFDNGFDIVFLDPPYDAAEEYEETLGLLGRSRADLLAADAVVVAEHRRKQKLADGYGALARTRLLEQGDASLSFYSVSG